MLGDAFKSPDSFDMGFFDTYGDASKTHPFDLGCEDSDGNAPNATDSFRFD